MLLCVIWSLNATEFGIDLRMLLVTVSIRLAGEAEDGRQRTALLIRVNAAEGVRELERIQRLGEIAA